MYYTYYIACGALYNTYYTNVTFRTMKPHRVYGPRRQCGALAVGANGETLIKRRTQQVNK